MRGHENETFREGVVLNKSVVGQVVDKQLDGVWNRRLSVYFALIENPKSVESIDFKA